MPGGQGVAQAGACLCCGVRVAQLCGIPYWLMPSLGLEREAVPVMTRELVE